ncbi:unnamed protein product [Timema podura]|uniref:Uncharacterized protein n=1 Tax=Timema podura TaxID=61482 RepID=A0ABN7P5K6_TIMPD|nr:unnamed protein product [Timema podura]
MPSNEHVVLVNGCVKVDLVEGVEEVVTNIKDSGNYYFSIKNYTDANRKYKKAIRYIDWCKTQSDKINSYDEMKLSEIKLVCLLNQAAVKLKMNLFREALYLCDKGLLIDGKCAKAFYRRGQARIGLNDYEMALKDLKTALLLVPNNKSIKLEIISLRNRMRNYLLLEKARFEKMLK